MTATASGPETLLRNHKLVRMFNLGTSLFRVAPGALAMVSSHPRTDRELESIGDEFSATLSDLGPLYIKLGQILATRSDLLPEQVRKSIAHLQDDCAPSSFEYIDKRLRAALRARPGTVFKDLDSTPVACGSVAQVHRAITRDGRSVAIKVIKEGVVDQLRADVVLVERLLGAGASMLPLLRKYGVHLHFKEAAKLLRAQTDLHREASDQEEIAARFAGHPFVRIPQPLRPYCTDDVLVMDFVEGIRGQDFAQVQIPPSDLAARLQYAMSTMLYTYGVFHADPHPGNVIFSRDGKVTFVDFGLVGRLSEDEKWALSSFYYACIRRDWDRAVERFVKHFVIGREGIEQNREQFAEKFKRVLRFHYEEQCSRWSTLAFVRDGQDVLRLFGAKYSSEFTHVAMACLTGEGFLSQIHPTIDIWKNARLFTDRMSPYMSEEVMKRFDAEFAETHVQSRALKQRASKVLVAPTHLDRYVLPSTFPLFVRRARGCTFEDVDGNHYVDLSSGYGPHILGYGHPVLVESIRRATEEGTVNAIGSEAEVRLAEEISKAFPARPKTVLSNSGTEAVIQALRICRTARRRAKIAKFEGHYHGFSDQGLISSWFRFNGPVHEPIAIAPTGVHDAVIRDTLVLPHGSPRALDLLERHADSLAAVICEPFTSALAGSDREFLGELRELCTRHSLPLVFDEVVSGFRVTYGGIQNLLGITPDLTCLGKIIGGGLPCGAVTGRPDLLDLCKTSQDPFVDFETKTFVGGTMSGNSLTCSAGYAMLCHLRDHPEIYDALQDKTAKLVEGLGEVARQECVDYFVRGSRSILSMTFSHRQARSVREQHTGSNYKANVALSYYMRKHGVYLPELHTILLNAAHTEESLARVVEAFRFSLREMKNDGFFVI